MASANKTEKLGLNLWTQDDVPKREDFLSDNEKIDEAVGKLQENELKYVTQGYTGDGKGVLMLTFERNPKCVFITCQTHADCEYVGEENRIYGGTFIADKYPRGVSISGKKVIIKQIEHYHLNDEGLEYCIAVIC